MRTTVPEERDAELEKCIEDVLKSIEIPGRPLTIGSQVGFELIGPSFVAGRDDSQLLIAMQAFMEHELAQLRERNNVRPFVLGTHSPYEQVNLDKAARNRKLECLSYLYATHILELDDSILAEATNVSLRTLVSRRRQGRIDLARHLVAQAASSTTATNAADEHVASVVATSHEPSAREQVKVSPQVAIRQRLIAEVRRTWLDGVYRKNLHGRPPMLLRMVNRPQYIRGRWTTFVQDAAQPAGEQPHETTLDDVWETYEHELLIVGNAGAGKTTALLELAGVLLGRAEADEHEPVPVVFHLASWAEQREPIERWLRKELDLRYRIDDAWSAHALDAATIVVLLDGLDEVGEEYQAACAEAINAFRDTHGALGTAVCCRSTTMDVLSPLRLHLSGAVELQPLSPMEIERRLSVSDDASDARPSLPCDHPAYSLLATPLMLDTFITTHGAAMSAALADVTEQTSRETLFEGYTRNVFRRREEHLAFGEDQTVGSLSWLAWQMERHDRTFFEIEALDSSWLEGEARLRYVRTVRVWRMVAYGLALGMLATTGLLVIFLDTFAGFFGVQPDVWAMLLTLVVGCVAVIVPFCVYAVRQVTPDSQERIVPVEELFRSKPQRWSWIIAGIAVSMLLVWAAIPTYGIAWSGFLGALVVASAVLVSYLYVTDVRSKPPEERGQPNQGIIQSGRMALRVGAATLLLISPATAFVHALSGATQRAWIIGPVCGLSLSLIGVMIYGGEAWAMHWLLRRTLEREGAIPRHLPALLTFAVERVLMYRVGGRYQFFHKQFQEYLAMRRTNDSQAR